MSTKSEWFADWFNTPYYHTLYQHRDRTEAQTFINNLMNKVKLDENARILDLACGRGRHAMQLAQMNYQVVGVDLSPANIEFANKAKNDHPKVEFKVGDMRNSLGDNEYDAVLNAFTSFGYFNSKAEHQQVINNIYACLKNSGLFFFDYLNARAIPSTNNKEIVQEIEGIHFSTKRSLLNQHVVKEISVQDGDMTMHFMEKVALYYKDDFIEMLTKANFKIIQIWGNYFLEPFIENASPRLIILAQK